MQQPIVCNTLRGYLKAISGLFITKDNPAGFTPKELDMLELLIFLLDEEKSTTVTANIKRKMAEVSNHPLQVITNYIKKLRDKKALTPDNKLHRFLRTTELQIHNNYAKSKTKEAENNL